ncbi:SHOCT domain-containing protein [Embleya scabrispora]|uniref:SHOCT domain-containing protein n=1 Tax=Embleya scabrispora TaxID=159449 RepID=UPI00131A1B46|nr:SHOCT domain-containing protein [Embleya scabrispora]MYS86315.1 hypothetical protein [Streptomyces sp. SID5474]
MKSFLRAGVGGFLLLTSLAVAAYSFYQLARTGSCSSGGVYVSKRECPAGTAQWAFALPISLITGMLSVFLLRACLRGGTPEPFAPDGEIAGPRPAHPYTGRGGDMIRLLLRHQASAGGSPAPAGDPLVRLERLRALLASGALTPAEFEQAKARILGEL